jgi:Ca2+ transporting ATPase
VWELIKGCFEDDML